MHSSSLEVLVVAVHMERSAGLLNDKLSDVSDSLEKNSMKMELVTEDLLNNLPRLQPPVNGLVPCTGFRFHLLVHVVLSSGCFEEFETIVVASICQDHFSAVNVHLMDNVVTGNP